MKRDELKAKQIGVLMGGLSGEREVSLRTGAAVLKALQQKGYRCTAIDAGRDLAGQLRDSGIEVAFIALHGRYGEDGTVQGLLELMGIPYTGSGVLASSLAMDKIVTKKLLIHHDLPTPGFETYRRGEDLERLVARCRHYPLVVKPAREGSTLGISIVGDGDALRQGIVEALRFDDQLLIEEYIAGRELTVAVLDGEALPIIEIEVEGGFYDFGAKYGSGKTRYLLPAPLEPALYQRMQEVAVAACAALGCCGAARVDFRAKEREFYCLEVNTIPGMTETSLLPKAAQAAGMDFAELTIRILEGAALNK
ncbi:D-alanine--D-alanine ligase [Geoalkalibacter halelectricus]|uniref:D-alanine--D-alanine ligase n=1 Tax=Geoalkalibacter halelectricus TaxID=2847045 RepID=A0ABY5ZR73_9BACT|nr:D-alanine--D-alanine ligase [Geoalkalibacter halelectricus]UWZ81628.1 D-alanine--D-alanine ligase [Geoalkalibacter halelectricus]